jgi:hypothetical protein
MRLCDLPIAYLEWLGGLDDLRDPLRVAIDAEIRRRRGPRPDPRIAEDLIARGQRSLAKSAHPDAGGTHEAMLAIRAAADWLFSVVSRELRA